jgi:hypothetical protein
MKFELTRHFDMFNKHVGFGINYEMQNGTLFGFETGHRVGLILKI